MERRTVDLRIGGQSYRVVTTAEEAELRRLAEVVTSKLQEVTPKGRPQTPQTLLLAALALAHEAQSEREQRAEVERKTRDLLRRVLVRVEGALEPLAPESPGDADEWFT